MKSISCLWILITSLLILSACKMENPGPPIGDAEIVLNIPGQNPIIFDQIQATVDTDAETSHFVHAQLTAISPTGEQLSIRLNDDDTTANPFLPGLNFPINTGTTAVNAIFELTQGGTTKQGTSGSISLNVYECLERGSGPGNGDIIRLSGEFTVTIEGMQMTGTFTDIRVECIECEGTC